MFSFFFFDPFPFSTFFSPFLFLRFFPKQNQVIVSYLVLLLVCFEALVVYNVASWERVLQWFQGMRRAKHARAPNESGGYAELLPWHMFTVGHRMKCERVPMKIN